MAPQGPAALGWPLMKPVPRLAQPTGLPHGVDNGNGLGVTDPLSSSSSSRVVHAAISRYLGFLAAFALAQWIGR